MAAEMEVPSDFLCPISLQIMRDPVTISTGITYDRESIEKWLSRACLEGQRVAVPSCPVTKQPLRYSDLTPNHTLRRLIQGWCSVNAGRGVEQIPTPKAEVDRGRVAKILKEAVRCPTSTLDCLNRLKAIVAESPNNKIYLQDAESMEWLASILNNNDESIIEEAIEILSNTNSPTTVLRHLLTQFPLLIETLISIIATTETPSTRSAAMAFLSSLYAISDQALKTFTKDTLFLELTRAISDRMGTKSALQILLHVAPCGRNRLKAVKYGIVFHLVELLVSSGVPRECELAMAALDRLCECAEGRAELLRHGGGVAVVARKIVGVSSLTNEKAVRILYNVCRNNVGNLGVAEEMVEVGVVGELCLALQMGGSLKMKDRVKEVLHLIQCVFKASNNCSKALPFVNRKDW